MRLAIRCPGEITRDKLDTLRLADEIYIEEIRRAGLYDDSWRDFSRSRPDQCREKSALSLASRR